VEIHVLQGEVSWLLTTRISRTFPPPMAIPPSPRGALAPDRSHLRHSTPRQSSAVHAKGEQGAAARAGALITGGLTLGRERGGEDGGKIAEAIASATREKRRERIDLRNQAETLDCTRPRSSLGRARRKVSG